MQVGNFKAEADDALDYSPEGTLIWHFGTKGGRARACDHAAVVELRAQHRTGLTRESDLVVYGPTG